MNDKESRFTLVTSNQGLQLVDLAKPQNSPLRIDFVHGALAHRRQFGGGKSQMIAKAVGISAGVRPRILDATAGLAQDAFVFASLGCQVRLIERQPLLIALLNDALQRAYEVPETAAIVARMQLIAGDALHLLSHWQDDIPHVIYLDPMFPLRKKSAQVKKEMSLLHELLGQEADSADLLDKALQLASHRVVVKRPRIAPPLTEKTPSYTLQGQASRFDIYTKHSLRVVKNM